MIVVLECEARPRTCELEKKVARSADAPTSLFF
jgi:hypothetical protein